MSVSKSQHKATSQAAPTIGTQPVKFESRFRFFVGSVAFVMVIVLGKFLFLQTIGGSGYAEAAKLQRTVVEDVLAARGDIVDRNGRPFALSRETRRLRFVPFIEEQAITREHEKSKNQYPSFDQWVENVLEEFDTLFGQDTDLADVESKLRSGSRYQQILIENISAKKADAITTRFPHIASDKVFTREYPGGTLASPIIGKARLDPSLQLVGQLGLEFQFDEILSGSNGRVEYERGLLRDASREFLISQSVTVPKSRRVVADTKDGADLHLTLDSDIQYFLQNTLVSAKEKSGAKEAMAVVLDAKNAEILAMAQSSAFDARFGLESRENENLDKSNKPIEMEFDPGSVHKIVTASGVLNDGLSQPDEVLLVDGSIRMEGSTVRDAWVHGPTQYTMTGVMGKSSNVGTLMLAQRLGKQRFYELMVGYGLAGPTGVDLPGEFSGRLRTLQEWTPGDFANMPIGQSIGMNLLHMAGIYQTVANDGVRKKPHVIKEIRHSDGRRETPNMAMTHRVISEQAARATREVFRAPVQSADGGLQGGTGPQAAVAGYKVSGKTGTAQKFDPACRCYSNSKYFITFAGIAPTDDPRFVIAIVLDEPVRGPNGEGGQTAAPLFGTIASWLLNRFNVPPQAEDPERLTLQIAG